MTNRTILTLACTVLVTTAMPAAAQAQQGDPSGSQEAYPPSYFKDRKPEVVAPRSGRATPRAVLDGKWGWVHITRKWSDRTAKQKSRQLRDTAAVAAAISGVLGLVPGANVTVAAVGIVQAYGTNALANRVSDAREDAKGRGVRFDAGLWCYNVPVLPDPCRPRLVIKPR